MAWVEMLVRERDVKGLIAPPCQSVDLCSIILEFPYGEGICTFSGVCTALYQYLLSTFFLSKLRRKKDRKLFARKADIALCLKQSTRRSVGEIDHPDIATLANSFKILPTVIGQKFKAVDSSVISTFPPAHSLPRVSKVHGGREELLSHWNFLGDHHEGRV